MDIGPVTFSLRRRRPNDEELDLLRTHASDQPGNENSKLTLASALIARSNFPEALLLCDELGETSEVGETHTLTGVLAGLALEGMGRRQDAHVRWLWVIDHGTPEDRRIARRMMRSYPMKA